MISFVFTINTIINECCAYAIPSGPDFADVFMCCFEKMSESLPFYDVLPLILVFILVIGHYVDDIIVLFPSSNHEEKFQRYLSSKNIKIKTTWKKKEMIVHLF